MARPPFPIHPDEITADWLRQSGADSGSATSVQAARIGQDEGFSGCRLYRLMPDRGPSLVAKLSPADPVVAGRMAAANAREVAFYAAHGQDAALPVPRCPVAVSDAATGASLLILQDLGKDRAVPFGAGLGVGDARLALRALAGLHARWWGYAALPTPETPQRSHPFQRLWPAYLDHIARNGNDLSPTLKRLGDRIAADPEAACARMTGNAPLTRVHGDAQADNLRFGAGPAARLIDWQMTGVGPGMADVGYLLISSLTPTVRRRHEADLIDLWRAELVALGVAAGADPDGYLLAAAGKLWVTVAATLTWDNASPAKQAWRRTDLARLAAFCDDHDPARVLG